MNIRFQHITSFIILLSCVFSAKAQSILESIATPTEKVYVSTSNQTLLVGESLRYTFFNREAKSKSPSKLSTIGYVDLLNSNGEIVKKQAIELENAMGSGSFYIPTNTKSGRYKLIAYTRWMLNRPVSELFQTDIYIINPFQNPEKDLVSNATDSVQTFSSQLKPITSEVLTASLAQNNYKKRQKISLNLEASIAMQFSISVRKVDLLEKNKNATPKSFSRNTITKSSTKNSNLLLPELRGQLVKGHISGPNVAGKSIALSIPGVGNSQTSLVNTNKKGVFYFNLDANKSQEQAYIEVFEDNREEFTISLDSLAIDYKKLHFENTPFLHASMQKALKDRAIALQIQNAYFDYKKDSILKKPASAPFYDALKKVYVLDEYTRFPSLAETIVEIANEIYFKKNQGKYSIHLRDRDNFTTSEVYGSSLVLFNGSVVQDVNKLFDLPAKNIKKIEFINKGYVFGPRIFNGVVNFVNKDFNYQLKTDNSYRIKTDFNRPTAKHIANQPDYEKNQGLKKIPDYRYQLYWKPKTKLKKESKTFTFFTSDVTGSFEILIEGFTTKGKPVLIKKYFKVEK